MSDIPRNEEDILNNLVEIRNKLTLLKQDRSTYLKSSDVWEIYGEVQQEIHKLVVIRSVPEKLHEQNRVDVVLDDVFQVMSLAFLTVGVTNKAPATFASLCAVKRLLDHLSESSTYTENDVEPIRDRLKEIAAIVEQDELELKQEGQDIPGSNPEEVVLLIKQKLSVCQEALKRVEQSMDSIAPELAPVMQKLVNIRREIMAIGSRPKFSAHSFAPLKEQLRTIETARVDDKFIGADGQPIKEGQSTVNGILEKCHTLINDFLAHEERVDPSLKPIYNQLVEMKGTLEGLLVTHRWTLRETDLYFFQKKLQEIDDLRVNGVFRGDKPTSASAVAEHPSSHGTPTGSGAVTPSGTPVPKGQSILLYLIRRCYAIIYRLLESSEPVSEALTPIHNQLTTTRRCLLDVKRMGGLSSARELYPYQMKLASIDNLRVDGKFMVASTIPEGQGMLNALLSECFDICHELKVEMDEQNTEVDDVAEGATSKLAAASLDDD